MSFFVFFCRASIGTSERLGRKTTEQPQFDIPALTTLLGLAHCLPLLGVTLSPAKVCRGPTPSIIRLRSHRHVNRER